MSWWKRCLFMIGSLLWGFVSLDYLMFSYRCLRGTAIISFLNLEGQGILQLIGAVLFIVWFLLVGLYLWIIRRFSIPITVIETDAKTGSEKLHWKRFDQLLQSIFIVVGMAIRFLYLLMYYFPKYK